MIQLQAHRLFVSRDFSELQAALEDDVDPVFAQRDRRAGARPRPPTVVRPDRSDRPDAG